MEAGTKKVRKIAAVFVQGTFNEPCETEICFFWCPRAKLTKARVAPRWDV